MVGFYKILFLENAGKPWTESVHMSHAI